ncbi:MAG: GNAT family N-acetyltransferase [Planctomycetota bacterium]|jgi:GNAT superfamily N-acetyltransferase
MTSTISGRGILIRPAVPSDESIIVRFNANMARETEDKALETSVLENGVRLALTDASHALYFVAEVDGQVVGQTMVTLEWSDWRNGFFWWIQSVYVNPVHRRQGVFRALYQHVRTAARTRDDVCGLRLYVHHKNDRALETYRKLGMVVTDYRLCEEEW